jgi:hypothetical protein
MSSDCMSLRFSCDGSMTKRCLLSLLACSYGSLVRLVVGQPTRPTSNEGRLEEVRWHQCTATAKVKIAVEVLMKIKPRSKMEMMLV